MEARASRLSLRAAQQMIQLRQALDQDAGGQLPLSATPMPDIQKSSSPRLLALASLGSSKAIIASCVWKAPKAQPFLRSFLNSASLALTILRCSSLHPSSADGSFGTIDAAYSSRSPALMPHYVGLSLGLMTVIIFRVQQVLLAFPSSAA